MREADTVAPARGLSPCNEGVGDGCRSQGGTVSLATPVTIDDDHRCGLGPGNFQRGLDTLQAVIFQRTKGFGMQGLGYDAEHGRVAPDRRIPCNAPGLGIDLLFLRRRESPASTDEPESRAMPARRFAPGYVRKLAPAAEQRKQAAPAEH